MAGADRFELLDLGTVGQGLRIDIENYIGIGPADEPDNMPTNTWLRLRPPLTDAEHVTLVESVGPESKLGELLVSATEKTEIDPIFTSTGEPSVEHLARAAQLALAIMKIRGFTAGRILTDIDGTTHDYLVSSEFSSRTLIDPDELEADGRDPAVWQDFVTASRQYHRSPSRLTA